MGGVVEGGCVGEGWVWLDGSEGAEGFSDEEIEDELELKRGTVGRLGRRGIVGATGLGAWE